LAGAGLMAECLVPAWDLAAPLNGSFAESCPVRDLVPGSVSENAVRAYAVEVAEAGVYQFTLSAAGFDAALVITDARFRQIAPADPRATVTRTGVSLTPETYYVLVIAVRGTGEFSLSASREDPALCLFKDLPGGALSGQIAAGGCRLQHALALSDQTRPAEVYRFQTDQPRVLGALMESRTVDSLLVLIDAKTGRTLGVDDDGADGVANSLLVQSLAPGDYLLVATVAGTQTGAYSLQAVVGEPRACNTREIRPGEGGNGQLTEADCRLLDVVAGDDRENRLELFRMQVTDPGVLTVELRSNEFAAAVLLFDAGKRLVQSAVPQQFNQPARLVTSVAPGEYWIGAAHAELLAGNYQLQTRFEPIRPCALETLPVDGGLSSALRSNDCRYLDRIPLSTDVTLIKPYTVTLEKRGVLTVDMTSAQVDSYLWIFDSQNRVIAEDDNSGGGRNARVSVQLDPGAYAVFANTAAVETGSFEIKAALAEARACEALNLQPGEPAAGQLTGEGCVIRDVTLGDGRGTSAQLYKLTLAEAGKLTLDLRSFSFAPSLILLDAEGKRLASDALAAPATVGVSRIRQELPAGTYNVVVTATAGRAGDYTLRAAVRR
jgi:hypothetical protein